MTTKERNRIDYFRMAMALNGIAVDNQTAELIIENWNGILEKGGQFSIHDSVEIEFAVKKRYQIKRGVKAIAGPAKKKK